MPKATTTTKTAHAKGHAEARRVANELGKIVYLRKWGDGWEILDAPANNAVCVFPSSLLKTD